MGDLTNARGTAPPNSARSCIASRLTFLLNRLPIHSCLVFGQLVFRWPLTMTAELFDMCSMNVPPPTLNGFRGRRLPPDALQTQQRLDNLGDSSRQ